MFSIILPAGGSFSFYVECVLKNTYETCGLNPKNIDFIILTGNNVHPRLKEELFFLTFKYPFRIIETPFNEIWHLPMLDWAMRNVPDLQEWVVPIHCDGFWKIKNNWLLEYQNQALSNPKAGIIVVGARHYWSTYALDGEWLAQTYDHIGAYKLSYLLEHDLSFKWGKQREHKISPELKEVIDNKRLLRRGHADALTPIDDEHWFDGSQLIGLETAIRFPESVQAINKDHNQCHIGGFNREINSLTKIGNTLHFETCQRTLKYNFYKWAFHSCVTSYFLDKDEYEDIILPWGFMKHFCTHPLQSEPLGGILRLFHTYFGKHPNCLGEKSLNGIKNLKLRGYNLDCFKYYN